MCRTKLAKRGRPIVLGESNRITERPMMPIEYELRKRVLAENAALDQRQRVSASTGSATGPPSALLDEGDAAPSRHSRKSPKVRDRRRVAKPRQVERPVEPPRVVPAADPPVASAPERARPTHPTREGTTPNPAPVIDDVFTFFEPEATAVVEPEIVVETSAVEAPAPSSWVVEAPEARGWVEVVEAVEAEVVEPGVVKPDVVEAVAAEPAIAAAAPVIDDVFTRFESEFTTAAPEPATSTPSWVEVVEAAEAAEAAETARVVAERTEMARVAATEAAEAARIEAEVEAERVEAERVETARVEAARVEAERDVGTPEVVDTATREPKIVFVPEAIETVVAEPEVVQAEVAEAKIFFVPAGVEAVVAEPEVVVPEVIDLSEITEPVAQPKAETTTSRRRRRTPRARRAEPPAPEAREVITPEVVFETEVTAASVHEAGPAPEMIDLTAERTVELKGELTSESGDDAAEHRGQARPNMFSATSRNPRVKKMVKGRRGWVVDYVIPEKESKDTGS